MRVVCSWCGTLIREDDVEASQNVADMLEVSACDIESHGMCAECADDMNEELDTIDIYGGKCHRCDASAIECFDGIPCCDDCSRQLAREEAEGDRRCERYY